MVLGSGIIAHMSCSELSLKSRLLAPADTWRPGWGVGAPCFLGRWHGWEGESSMGVRLPGLCPPSIAYLLGSPGGISSPVKWG